MINNVSESSQEIKENEIKFIFNNGLNLSATGPIDVILFRESRTLKVTLPDFLMVKESNTYTTDLTSFVSQAKTSSIVLTFTDTTSAETITKCVVSSTAPVLSEEAVITFTGSKVTCDFTLDQKIFSIKYNFILTTYTDLDLCEESQEKTTNIKLNPNSIVADSLNILIPASKTFDITTKSRLPGIPTVVLTSIIPGLEIIDCTATLVGTGNVVTITIPAHVSTIPEAKYTITITNSLNSFESIFFLYNKISLVNTEEYVMKGTDFTSIKITLKNTIHEDRIKQLKYGVDNKVVDVSYANKVLTITTTGLTFTAGGAFVFTLIDAMTSEMPLVTYTVNVFSFTITPIVFVSNPDNGIHKKGEIEFTPAIPFDKYNKMTAKKDSTNLIFDITTTATTGTATTFTLTYSDPITDNSNWGRFTEVTLSKGEDVITSSISLIIINKDVIPKFDKTEIKKKYSSPVIYIIKTDTTVTNDSKYLYDEYFTSNKIIATLESEVVCDFDSLISDGLTEITLTCPYIIQPASEKITITSFSTPYVIPVTLLCDETSQTWNNKRNVCECNSLTEVNENGTCKATCTTTTNPVNKCICASGKGLLPTGTENEYSCIDQTITALTPTSVIYINDRPNEIIITFNTMVHSSDVTKFTLTRKTRLRTLVDHIVTGNEIPKAQCTLDGLSTKYTCPGLIFSGLVKGTYVLSWNDNGLAEGKNITFEYSLEFVSLETSYQLPARGQTKIIPLTYTQPLHSGTTFKLYSFKTNAPIGADLLKNIIGDKTKVELTLSDSTAEGKYSIATSLKEETNKNEGKHTLFYKEALAFDSRQVSLTVNLNDPFTFDLLFVNTIFDERITITYKKPGDAIDYTDANFSIDETFKKITVSVTSGRFSIEGTYIFTITDNATSDTPLNYEVIVIDPTKPTLGDNGVFFYKNDKTTTSKIIIPSGGIDPTTIDTIKATNTSPSQTVTFSLVKISGTTTDYHLNIIENMNIASITYWGKYDKLELIASDTSVLFTFDTFIMIKEGILPKTRTTLYKDGVMITKTMSKVDVSFDEKVYKEYLRKTDGVTPRLSIDGYTLIWKDEYSITIQKIPADAYLTAGSLNLIQYEDDVILIPLIYCENYKIAVSNKCEDCPMPNKYYDDKTNTCKDTCASPNKKYDDKVCVNTCKDLALPNTPLIYEEGLDTCVTECKIDGNGENTVSKICEEIKIKDITPKLRPEKDNQEFRIIMNVLVTIARVKIFGLFNTKVGGADDGSEIWKNACDLTGVAKNELTCTLANVLVVGDYNLYWYDKNNVKKGSPFKVKLTSNLVISITSVTPVLYAMFPSQTITITTDSVDYFTGKFKLQKDDKTIIKEITCSEVGSDTIVHICPDDTFADVPAGNYKIYWREVLPNLSSEGYLITLIDQSLKSITVDTFIPELGQLVQGNTVDFTLIYLGNYALATNTIELINVDTQATISIDKSNIIPDTNNAKIVILKIKSDTREGAYYIRTSSNGKTVTSAKYIIVYTDETITIPSPGSKTYEQGVELKNEVIIFSKPVFPSRIEKVVIEDTPIMFKVDATGILIILKTIIVGNTPTVIEITYKTLGPNTTVSYTINGQPPASGITYPTSAGITKKIYYHGTNSVYLTVHFNAAVPEANTFTSIQIAEKNIKFTMEAIDAQNEDFRLQLVDPLLITSWGQQTGIKFFAQTTDGSGKLRMITSAPETFVLLNLFNIPLTLINQKISFKNVDAINLNRKFALIFKEPVIPEYFLIIFI